MLVRTLLLKRKRSSAQKTKSNESLVVFENPNYVFQKSFSPLTFQVFLIIHSSWLFSSLNKYPVTYLENTERKLKFWNCLLRTQANSHYQLKSRGNTIWKPLQYSGAGSKRNVSAFNILIRKYLLKIYSEFHKNTTKTLVEDSTTSKAIH